MANDLKWLLFSDLHLPAHDKRALDILWRTIDMWEPDVVDIVGDLDDQSCFSRFTQGTPEEILNSYADYAKLSKEFLTDLRGALPDAEIVFHLGNHDIRYESYIEGKAPAFRDFINEETLWGVDTLGIQTYHYNDPPVHRYGDLFVHHGPYAYQDSGSSVKKALDSFHVSCLVGHSHRQAYVPQSYPLAQQQDLRGWEIGHLADIEHKDMNYDYKHNWQQGFAVARIDQRNYPHVNLVGINRDYTAFVEGHKVMG